MNGIPLISLVKATFRQTPTSRSIFPNTTFTLASPPTSQKWAVIGSSKSLFLRILSGSHLCFPPQSRLYPAIASRSKWAPSAIQLISFGSENDAGMLAGATAGSNYISARYETLREEFDVTLRQWLGGDGEGGVEEAAGKLGLVDLLDQEVMTLSNGQSRRARIAQALLRRPEVLLIDEPFLGLDPRQRAGLSTLLEGMSTPPVVLGLRAQDVLPKWCSHVVVVENEKVVGLGPKHEVRDKTGKSITFEEEEGSTPPARQGVVEQAWASSTSSSSPPPSLSNREAIVQMNNIAISYFGKPLLKNFSWTIRRGEKWGLFGPNGSGKTTLTALITSDHPLTYSLDVKHFGRHRLPEPGQKGISVFELQSRISVVSPEIHAFFPRSLTLRQCIRSGFAEAFTSVPKTSGRDERRIEKVLKEFKDLLTNKGGWGWEQEFGDADMSTQRLALFLRAVVPMRDLVVFDEAFSGMKAEARRRCFRYLGTSKGWEERQAMVVVSHVSEEVPPGVEKWVRLGEKGGVEDAVFGEVK